MLAYYAYALCSPRQITLASTSLAPRIGLPYTSLIPLVSLWSLYHLSSSFCASSAYYIRHIISATNSHASDGMGRIRVDTVDIRQIYKWISLRCCFALHFKPVTHTAPKRVKKKERERERQREPNMPDGTSTAWSNLSSSCFA